MSWKDIYAQEQHYKDLLREAEQDRLSRDVPKDKPRRTSISRSLLAALGGWMTNVGRQLEESSGEMEPAPSTPMGAGGKNRSHSRKA